MVLGIQRSFMFAVTLSLVVSSLFSTGDIAFEGWRAWPTLVAPSIVPIMVFVIGLDILMSFIYGLDAEPNTVKRYRWIIGINLFSIFLLFAFWAKFFIALVTVP